MSEGMNIRIDLDEAAAGPKVKALLAGLKDRTGVHEAVSRRVLNLTREHFTEIAQTRHETAQRLGASPTGHWAQAAEKTTSEHDAKEVTLNINQVGISRAAGDVEIRPKAGKKFLTLPMIAAAYGQRAYRVAGLFFIQKKNGKAFLGRKEGGKLSIWYALRTSVQQKQDRTLLPSDQDYLKAVIAGIGDYVGYLLARKGTA